MEELFYRLGGSLGTGLKNIIYWPSRQLNWKQKLILGLACLLCFISPQPLGYAILIGTIIYLIIKSKKKTVEEDEDLDVLGSARWARLKDYIIGNGTLKEPKSVLNSRVNYVEGEVTGVVVLGKVLFPPIKKKDPVIEDYIVSQGEGHILTIAGTGKGKGVNVVIPNVMAYQHPVVVIDPKGENFINTHYYREAFLKQEICLIDPFGHVVTELKAKINMLEDTNDLESQKAKEYFEVLASKCSTFGQYLKGFNPLQIIEDLFQKGDINQILDEAEVIADMLVVKTPEEKDPHWNEKAKTFIRGMILYVVFDEDCQAERDKYPINLLTVKRLIENRFSSPEKMKQFVADCKKHPELESVAGAVNLIASEERSSVLSKILLHLDFMNSRNVQESLTRNDFEMHDIRKNQKSIYLVLPANKMESYKRLMRLWIATIKNSLELINDGHRKTRPVLFMLDEVGQLGRMEPLKNAVSISRSFGIKLWFIFQDIAQMKKAYPDEEWGTFFSNTKIQQYFGVSASDVSTCEFVSKAAGQSTVSFATTSISVGRTNGSSSTYGSNDSSGPGGGSRGSNRSYGSNSSVTKTESLNQQIQARPLITPDEVPRITNDHILIFGATRFPIKAEKMPYYQMPNFDKRHPFQLEKKEMLKLEL